MNIEPLAEKFEAFGWKVIKVHDGHDFELLLEALSKAISVHRKPVVILARTIIGKGIPFAEGKHTYYGASLSKVEMDAVVRQAEILWHRA
jgi:transketolase